MSRNCIFSSVFLYLSIRYFSVSVATVITTNFLSFLDGFQWIATMKHARTNLTHFHCTKSTLTTYFHIFFFPLIARFLSLFFSFFLFLSSFSLRYNSLSFASYFPSHHFSRYSFHSFSHPSISFSFSIFIRTYTACIPSSIPPLLFVSLYSCPSISSL